MKIDHIAMYVNDLEKVKDFFITYFYAQTNDIYHNPKTDFKSYFITFDNNVRLEIMHKPNMLDIKKDYNHTSYIHIAFSVGSKDAVDALTKRLQDDGYEVMSGPRITGDGYYESCIVAIEDNLIEITI